MEDNKLSTAAVFENSVLDFNRKGMDELRLNNFEPAYVLLKKAELLLKNSSNNPTKTRLLAITFNNLG
jgi:hypothetical protein